MIDELIGKVVLNIHNNKNESLTFKCHDGSEYTMYHSQDCCESVHLDDINGDLDDLLGSTILQADESSSDGTGHNNCESGTWTFYKFATIKGYITLKWFGESNGYYSEGVNFDRTKEPNIKDMRKFKLKKIENLK